MADTAKLLRTMAANHRTYFRRQGGEPVRLASGLEVIVGSRDATLAFPPPRARTRAALDAAVAIGPPAMSCWSLRQDRRLGVLLMARGFEWGWQPHWMALDLARLPGEEPAHAVVPLRDPGPAELPYRGSRPRAADPLAVVEAGRIVGRVVVNLWRGSAGIYDMGVVEDRRRRGIGRALMLAAGRFARERGCTHMLLNATPDGEALYRTVGFESLGMGQTWWRHPGPRPAPRQAALVEAVGFGELGQLAALRPGRDELEAGIPGAGVPLAVAVVTGQAAVADWILTRRPDLTSRPLEPRGATLLHVAVEWDDEALLDVALAHGADRTVRDSVWNGTPLGWAEHLGRTRLAERLRAP